MRGYGSEREDYLFHKGDWFATENKWKNELVAAIEAMDDDELLNTSTSDLARYYADKYTLDIPIIYPDEITVSQRETKIDVSQDHGRYIRDRSRPFYLNGTSIDVELPFTGDKVAFDIQPTTQNFNNPRARIAESALNFSVTGTNLTTESVNAEVNRRVASISEHLGWLRNNAESYNAGLEALATQTIERRKEKLLKDRSLVAGLGFKIKQRPGATETFAAPSVRRNIRPARPKPTASREPYLPEPTLPDKDYQHILEVLTNMVRVIEQSPGAFREIDEESLRTHFLVQLNGHFLGGATGETFNYEGKTDILIKVDGRNIFIGECKFWNGRNLTLTRSTKSFLISAGEIQKRQF